MQIKVQHKPATHRVKMWWFKSDKPNQIDGIATWEKVKPKKITMPDSLWLQRQTTEYEEPAWTRE